MPLAFLCALGFAVVQVNYRGSTGYGETSLQSLPGNIGSQDVQDMLLAVDTVIASGLVDAPLHPPQPDLAEQLCA